MIHGKGDACVHASRGTRNMSPLIVQYIHYGNPIFFLKKKQQLRHGTELSFFLELVQNYHW